MFLKLETRVTKRLLEIGVGPSKEQPIKLNFKIIFVLDQLYQSNPDLFQH